MKKVDFPYFNERSAPIDTLVIHCMTERGLEDGMAELAKHEVSAHYIIDLEGNIFNLIPEEKRAWHAGKSYWRGREALNDFSIGIEVCSPSFGQEPYPSCQIEALISLCQEIIARYRIKPENIVAHSDIAPTRKPDPGKAFPWDVLAKNGIGFWYRFEDADQIDENNIEKLLSSIGYDISNLPAAKMAFCRRYLPQLVPTDPDIKHLELNPYQPDFDPQDQIFLKVLKAVAALYKKSLDMIDSSD